jgi:hypothetical protein
MGAALAAAPEDGPRPPAGQRRLAARPSDPSIPKAVLEAFDIVRYVLVVALPSANLVPGCPACFVWMASERGSTGRIVPGRRQCLKLVPTDAVGDYRRRSIEPVVRRGGPV